jgi:hypothetical protein
MERKLERLSADCSHHGRAGCPKCAGIIGRGGASRTVGITQQLTALTIAEDASHRSQREIQLSAHTFSTELGRQPTSFTTPTDISVVVEALH